MLASGWEEGQTAREEGGKDGKGEARETRLREGR